MSALFAFLHHVAAFALVAGIAIEFVLIRDANAHARLFAAVALLSVYPTLKFLSWRRKPPDAAGVAAIRRVLHLELVGIVLILLCAALMARGVGSFG